MKETFLKQFKTCGERHGLSCKMRYFDWYDLCYFDPCEDGWRIICRLSKDDVFVWDYVLDEYGGLQCKNAVKGRKISIDDLEDFVMDFAVLAKETKKIYRKKAIEEL